MEFNKIYNEDCLVGMKNIPDKSIDLILQDPPYNSTACEWEWDIMEKIDDFWNEWKRIIKDNGAIVMTSSQPFTSKLIISNLKMFKYEWIWIKDKPNNFAFANKVPMKYHENICVFYNKCKYNKQMQKRDGDGKRYKYSVDYSNQKSDHKTLKNGIKFFDKDWKNPSSYQFFSTGRRQDSLHPTGKPVALFEYLIRTYTNEGDTVFDGFMGSGTTAIACINTNRKYIGFELDKKYFDIAENRISEVQPTLFHNTIGVIE